MRYRKQPIIVEAVQWTGTDESWAELLAFAGALNLTAAGQHQIWDHLHSTWVSFEVGDWIIKGIRGEFYPCEGSVFAETYEAVDD